MGTVAEAPTVEDYGELKRIIAESIDGFSKHLARVEDRLIQRIETAESSTNRRIDRVEDRLNERLDGIEQRLDRMETLLTTVTTFTGEFYKFLEKRANEDDDT